MIGARDFHEQYRNGVTHSFLHTLLFREIVRATEKFEQAVNHDSSNCVSNQDTTASRSTVSRPWKK